MSRRGIHKRIRRWLVYVFVLFFVRVLRSVNRLTAIRLTLLIGRIAFCLAKGARNRTIRHLTWAFGTEKSPEEIKDLAQKAFLNLATSAADAIRLPILIEQGLSNLVTVEGFHHLKNARAKGKGTILLSGHFGNWELLAAWLAQNGLPLKVIGRSVYDPRLDEMLVDVRNKAGYTNIPRGKSSKEIIRSLKLGYVLGLLIDQDTKVKGVFTNFFGRPAHTATGPIILSQKFGAPIVPIFIRLRKDLTYHVYCGEELSLENTGDEKRDLIVNTQKCSDVYEGIIRRFPDQWVWMHQRWKKQPTSVS
jgi:KDO2-lipid IV(A) lauroyltransferase